MRNPILLASGAVLIAMGIWTTIQSGYNAVSVGCLYLGFTLELAGWLTDPRRRRPQTG